MKSRQREFAILFLWWPWFSMAAIVAFSVMFPATAQSVGLWALLASAMLFGLPHGACDLWAIGQALRDDKRDDQCDNKTATSSTRSKSRTWRNWRVRNWRAWSWIAAYIFAALMTLLLWRVSSSLALMTFLLLSVWHFGSADAWLHHVLQIDKNARRQRARAAFVCLSWGRGLLVINAPLTLQPLATQEILGGFAKLSGSSDDIALLWKIAPFLLLCGAILQGLGYFLSRSNDETSARATSSTRSVGFAALWLETLWLLILFAFAPPLLAVACYFIAVHSWRHVLRLELFGGDSNHDSPSSNWMQSVRQALGFARRAIVQQHRHGLLLGAVSLLGIVPILLWWPSLLGDVSRWNTAYLVLISAVTVPHATVVAWLEARHDL